MSGKKIRWSKQEGPRRPNNGQEEMYDLTTWTPEKLIAEIQRLRQRVHDVAGEADARSGEWQKKYVELKSLMDWAKADWERHGIGSWAHQSLRTRYWILALAKQRDDALAQVATAAADAMAEGAKDLRKLTHELDQCRAWATTRGKKVLEILRMPYGRTTWDEVYAEITRLREAHDDHLNAEALKAEGSSDGIPG